MEKGSIRSTLISRHHPIGLIGVEPTNLIGGGGERGRERERERSGLPDRNVLNTRMVALEGRVDGSRARFRGREEKRKARSFIGGGEDSEFREFGEILEESYRKI